MNKKFLLRVTGFAATIIVLCVLFVFIESRKNFRPFFQEAYVLYTRYVKALNYKNEIYHAKKLLQLTISEEHTPENWGAITGELTERMPDASFYTFKVWFIESGVSIEDIENSYPTMIFKDEYATRLILNYSKDLPEISFNIFNDNNDIKADAYFSLNNCLFSADYNKDEKIDYQDVVIARKYWANRPRPN